MLFVQTFEEANNNLAANKALLGQLYIMNNQDYLALHELQVACPILSDYDVAVRTSYFDGWVDCYAALGHLHIKIENFDVALDLQNEMLGKMPWMRLALPGWEMRSSSSPTTRISYGVCPAPRISCMFALHTKKGGFRLRA